MIRFLQAKDSRVAKAIFIVIIAAVSVGMVVYLIPSFISGVSANAQDTYAVIYPHWYSKFFSSGATITQTKVDRMTRQQLMRQNPQYADNPMIIQMFEPRVGQQLVQQQIMLLEAAKLGISASDDDVVQHLHEGQLGEVFYPKGVFIGEDKYKNIIATQAQMSVTDFENELRQGIIIERLQSLITAGVSVGDAEVRDSYRKQNIKIKFDYAVISADDIRKTINPTDAELQAFFLKNGPRYATAVGEQRKITFFSFTPEQLPGGVPQPSQQEIQQYFNAASGRVSGARAGPGAPHPYQGGAGRRCQDRCRGQGQGRGYPEADSGRRQLCRSGQEELRRPRQQGLRRRAGLCQARQDGAGV